MKKFVTISSNAVKTVGNKLGKFYAMLALAVMLGSQAIAVDPVLEDMIGTEVTNTKTKVLGILALVVPIIGIFLLIKLGKRATNKA